ncbi:hypothetical protein CK219_05245 [Mesorhizobium sp. WSM4313]|nr:hypothetical protein CK219_05245 [Mesorhizobium sp. WSM4313]
MGLRDDPIHDLARAVDPQLLKPQGGDLFQLTRDPFWKGDGDEPAGQLRFSGYGVEDPVRHRKQHHLQAIEDRPL